MLVLSRKSGEAIVLAGNITIQVLGIEHDRVKIGVDAPQDVLVLRAELVPGFEPPAAVLAERPMHAHHAHAHNHRMDGLSPRHLRPLRPLPQEE
jgi:carbon storage regulator CsrA